MMTGHDVYNVLQIHSRALESGTLSVTCIECGKRKSVHVEVLDAVSDEKARVMFEKMGWSIAPTRCPKCVQKLHGGKI